MLTRNDFKSRNKEIYCHFQNYCKRLTEQYLERYRNDWKYPNRAIISQLHWGNVQRNQHRDLFILVLVGFGIQLRTESSTYIIAIKNASTKQKMTARTINTSFDHEHTEECGDIVRR